MSAHVVIGEGTANKSVIQEGLRDVLKDGDTLVIPWYGTKPVSKGLEAVYDYMLEENEADVNVTLVHANGTRVPGFFTDEDAEEFVSLLACANVNTKLLRSLDGKGAKVLVLWDAEDKDVSIELAQRIFDAVDESTLVLSLTNGLVPITLEGSEPAKEKVEEPEDTPPQALTEAELNGMPARALKKMAKDKGLPDGIVGTVNYVSWILTGKLPAAAYPPGQEPENQKDELVKPARSRRTRNHPSESTTLTALEGSNEPTATVTVLGLDELKAALTPAVPTDDQAEAIATIRSAALSFGEVILTTVQSNRNRSLALTHLEDVVTRCVRGIVLSA